MAFTGTERFHLIKPIGRGGMGTVYEAHDRVRDMRVALKILRRVHGKSLYRFKREFRTLNDLSHPNIITLYDLISHEENWFFTMELVEGEDAISYVRSGRAPQTVIAAAGEDDIETRTVFGSLQARLASEHRLPTPPPRRPPVAEVVDLQRLRAVSRQLGHALCFLHRAGLLHRDLKPSNVLVTGSGRVVLTDFGVVAEQRKPSSWDRLGGFIGTPAFMAPEQMEGKPLTAVADWYAFGVLLYRALTGVLPYRGSIATLLHLKKSVDPLLPSAFVDGIPADLEQLCMQLLQRNPAARPDGEAIMAQLGGAAPGSTANHQGTPRKRSAQVFIGRSQELATLHAAYRMATSGRAVTAFVRGHSGMGKTSLIERFVEERQHADGHAAAPIVLFGRCYERERLPHKAIDGVIDDLCGYLLGMSAARRRSITDAAAPALASGLLVKLFPVMRNVPGFDTGATEMDFNPVALRERAIADLRTLLDTVTRDRPIVMCIDDLQWADSESLEVLVRLVQANTPIRLLIVATMRAEEDAADRSSLDIVAKALTNLQQSCEYRSIELGPLADNEQRALMREVEADGYAYSTRLWHAFHRDMAGNPMLLIELARYASEEFDKPTDNDLLTLPAILWRRIAQLPTFELALLECVAVAGEPTPLHVLARSLDLPVQSCERIAATLRIGQLVRTCRNDHEPWLIVYHDKIRESVLAHLAPQRIRDLHGQLARALEIWGQASDAQLARHWMGAGDDEQAVLHWLAAGRSAAEQLALDHAVELYQAALAVLPQHPREPDQAALCGRVLLEVVALLCMLDRSDQALAFLDRALAISAAHALVPEQATAHYLRGNLLFPRGDVDGCLEAHTAASKLARRASSPDLEAKALSGLGDAYYMRGHIRIAHDYYHDCIQLCQEHSLVAIQAANLSLRGMARFYNNNLAAALRDTDRATQLATHIRRHRSEIVARGCAGIILIEAGRLQEAHQEHQLSFDMARTLGLRRFELQALIWLSKIAWMQGRQSEAEVLIHKGLDLCGDVGFSYFGPIALGIVTLVTRSAEERMRAFTDGEHYLQSGRRICYNYLYFYREAMDGFLANGDLDRVLHCARALENYTSAAELLPWSQFFIARARALVQYQRGQRTRALADELVRLQDTATSAQLYTAAAAINRALASSELAAISPSLVDNDNDTKSAA